MCDNTVQQFISKQAMHVCLSVCLVCLFFYLINLFNFMLGCGLPTHIKAKFDLIDLVYTAYHNKTVLTLTKNNERKLLLPLTKSN